MDKIGWPVWVFIIGGAALFYKMIYDEGKAEGYKECELRQAEKV